MSKKKIYPPTIKGLIRTLTKLTTGSRAWFWFCAEATDCPLLITQLAADPAMRSLGEQVASLQLPEHVRQCTGVVSVAENGTFHFGSTTASVMALIVRTPKKSWTRLGHLFVC